MSSERRTYELKARAERQEETRRRIVQATMELHQEVGPARTTVAEIARRAGVQRLTVYNHFPEDGQLFAACQGLFLSRHPIPDFAEALAVEDPRARTKAVLVALYESHRERQQMMSKILRDRAVLPALDELMRNGLDAGFAQLAEAIAGGFGVRGKRLVRVRALAALALDFWTWDRLNREGFDDAAAADLMADVVARAADRRS
jgi:AcrR family transcriptional regulator